MTYSKPDELVNTAPDSIFKINFFKIAHLKYAKAKFDLDVDNLRSAFCDQSHSQFLFRNFNYDLNLPIDAFATFGSQIWDTIKNNKDLNLPSQKILVANIRCTEIKKEIFDSFSEQLQSVKAKVRKGFFPEFKGIYTEILSSAFTTFESQAKNYVPEVFLEKKAELESDFFLEIRNSFAEQFKRIKKIVCEKFEAFNETLKRSNDMSQAASSISSQLSSLKGEATGMLEMSIVDESRFNKQELFEEIEDELMNIRDHSIQLLLNSYISRIESKTKKEIEKVANLLFNNLGEDFWDRLGVEYHKHLEEVESEVRKTLTEGFDYDSQKAASQIDSLKVGIFSLYLNQIEMKVTELAQYLLKKFKVVFGRKENGTPKNWTLISENEIEESFIECREQISGLTEIFSTLKLKHPLTPNGEDQELLSSVAIEKEVNDFKQLCEGEYNDAINKHVRTFFDNF